MNATKKMKEAIAQVESKWGKLEKHYGKDNPNDTHHRAYFDYCEMRDASSAHLYGGTYFVIVNKDGEIFYA